MVFPWAAVIGAASSAIQGRQVANESRRAQEQQAQLVQAQINEAAANRAMEQYFLNRSYADAQLGQTDAMGNRVYFVPGRGYVTELSPEGQRLQNASNEEQYQQLATDAPLARELMKRNYARQTDEGNYAATILDELKRGPQNSQSDLEALFRDRMMRDNNETFQRAQSDVAKQGLRTGADMSKTLAAMIGKQAKANRDAGVDAKLNAISAFDQQENNRTNRLGSLYGSFAGRASGALGNQFRPFDTSNLDAQTGANQRLMSSISAQYRPQNSLQGIQMPGANYIPAMAAGGVGQNVGALFDAFGGRQKGDTSSGPFTGRSSSANTAYNAMMKTFM